MKLQPTIRDECRESPKCAALAKHFDHCQEKVQSGQGFKGEDCVEELYVISSPICSFTDWRCRSLGVRFLSFYTACIYLTHPPSGIPSPVRITTSVMEYPLLILIPLA